MKILTYVRKIDKLIIPNIFQNNRMSIQSIIQLNFNLKILENQAKEVIST